MSRIFQKIGIKLPLRDMDIGNPERPQIEGYREKSPTQDLTNQKHHSQSWKKDDLKDIDFIYMMNFGNVHEIAEYYCQFEIPTYIHLFGQYNINLIHSLIDLAIGSDLINIVCYSQTEYKIYLRLSYDNKSFHSRLHYIPFGLDPDEFKDWKGNVKKVYTTCNDIHNRGESCGWGKYQKIVERLPSTLTGRNTEKVGGEGLLPYDKLKQYYQKYRCYLSMGTIPAPYTLTPLEAMMTGCPTAIYDNGMGISDEGIVDTFWDTYSCGTCSADIETLQNYLRRCLHDLPFAKEQSIKVREKAIEMFHIDKVAEQWKAILT